MARTFKRLMEQRRVTQQQVAKDTGVDKNTLSALIHGRESKVPTLKKLAKYFHVDVSAFLVGEVAESPGPEATSLMTLRTFNSVGSGKTTAGLETLIAAGRRDPNALHVLDAVEALLRHGEAQQRHLETLREFFLQGR